MLSLKNSTVEILRYGEMEYAAFIPPNIGETAVNAFLQKPPKPS